MPDIKGEMDWKWALACIVGGFIFAGYVDFLTGVEIRVYPLYFLPLSFAAWRFGRIGAFLAAVGATCVWVESNWVAGMHYSMDYVWIANTLAQCLAFGMTTRSTPSCSAQRGMAVRILPVASLSPIINRSGCVIL